MQKRSINKLRRRRLQRETRANARRRPTPLISSQSTPHFAARYDTDPHGTE
jgi:hypothetical protein